MADNPISAMGGIYFALLIALYNCNITSCVQSSILPIKMMINKGLAGYNRVYV